MKINSHCWLRTALQRLQCIFIILWKYSNKRRTAAAALIRGRRLLTFPPHVRRLIEGGAYSSKYVSSFLIPGLGSSASGINHITLSFASSLHEAYTKLYFYDTRFIGQIFRLVHTRINYESRIGTI